MREELEEGCMSMKEGGRLVYEGQYQEEGCVSMKEGGGLVYEGFDQEEGCMRRKEIQQVYGYSLKEGGRLCVRDRISRKDV